MESRFKGRVKKLAIGMGTGEIAIGITGLTDIWAVSLIGVEQLAGYAFTNLLITVLYGLVSTNQSMIYPEYARTRKVNIIFSYTIISFIITLIINAIVLLGLNSILSITELSLEARSVVLPVLIFRSFGIYAYLASVSLCTYMRTSGYDKEAALGRILTAGINIILDIVAVAAGTGVIGVALATTVAEVVELVYYNVVLFKKGKRYKREHFKRVSINVRNYATSLTHVMLARSLQAVLGTILTRLGDLGYAIYSIVYTINDIVCYFVYTYREVVIITYAEFSDSISNFYSKIQKIFSKLTFVWWLISCPITIVMVRILTSNESINVNAYTIMLLNVIMLYAEQTMQSNMGFCRILNNYRVSVISEITGSGAMIVLLHIALGYTTNPYLIIALMWSVYYLIIYCITYSTLKFKGGGLI